MRNIYLIWYTAAKAKTNKNRSEMAHFNEKQDGKNG